jgi:ABC-type amino acid transport substrate-binding protein
MKKNLKLIISIMSVLILLAGCGTTNEKEKETSTEVFNRVKDSGTLKIGFEGTYPPYNYVDEKDNYVGFDVDISKEIAKRLGVEAEFVAAPWDSLIGGLKADKFDIIIAQMAITEERRKSVDFTDSYVITGSVIITTEDNKELTNPDKLKGKKIGVVGGTLFEEEANKIEGADIRIYKNNADIIQDLKNNRIDANINDPLYMGYNIKTSDLPLVSSEELLNKLSIGMAIKKDNADLTKEINNILKEMKEDGTYQTIFKEWFGIEPTME